MMKQIVIYSFLALCILGLGTGCAVGQKYNYAAIVGDLTASGNKALAVATHDQRPDILSGAKSPDYVGTMRGGYGNPFDVGTESGKPMSDDMSQSISSSLLKKGFKTVPVVTLPKDSSENILEKLKTTQADNLILLTLYEWKSDFAGFVVFKSWLDYKATLTVFDNNGKSLAEAKIGGSDDLGNSGEPVSHSKKAVPEGVKKKIEELLNNPEVVKSLQQ